VFYYRVVTFMEHLILFLLSRWGSYLKWEGDWWVSPKHFQYFAKFFTRYVDQLGKDPVYHVISSAALLIFKYFEWWLACSIENFIHAIKLLLSINKMRCLGVREELWIIGPCTTYSILTTKNYFLQYISTANIFSPIEYTDTGFSGLYPYHVVNISFNNKFLVHRKTSVRSNYVLILYQLWYC